MSWDQYSTTLTINAFYWKEKNLLQVKSDLEDIERRLNKDVGNLVNEQNRLYTNIGSGDWMLKQFGE